MEKFTNFLTILTLIILFILWVIPSYMIFNGYDGLFGFIYFPLIGFTIAWCGMIYKKYYK